MCQGHLEEAELGEVELFLPVGQGWVSVGANLPTEDGLEPEIFLVRF